MPDNNRLFLYDLTIPKYNHTEPIKKGTTLSQVEKRIQEIEKIKNKL